MYSNCLVCFLLLRIVIWHANVDVDGIGFNAYICCRFRFFRKAVGGQTTPTQTFLTYGACGGLGLTRGVNPKCPGGGPIDDQSFWFVSKCIKHLRMIAIVWCRCIKRLRVEKSHFNQFRLLLRTFFSLRVQQGCWLSTVQSRDEHWTNSWIKIWIWLLPCLHIVWIVNLSLNKFDPGKQSEGLYKQWTAYVIPCNRLRRHVIVDSLHAKPLIHGLLTLGSQPF